MGKPYSIDIRERVVEAIERKGLSRRQAAERFGIAPSTAVNWMRRLRDTGSVEPGQMGGHRPKKIIGPHRDWLLERVEQNTNFTLQGLVRELAERGLEVDYRTVWTFMHDEKFRFKKNRGRK